MGLLSWLFGGRKLKNPSSTSELIILIDQPNTHELSHTSIGDSVNLWAPANDPTKIRIYRQGTIGGQGMLGLVPKKYVRLIARQKALQLPIGTEILGINPPSIRCRLISAEEFNKKKSEEQQKLRLELEKPYRPRKPVMFSVDAKSYLLDVGDRLKLSKAPTIDECLVGLHEAVLVFSTLDGKKNIKKSDELTIIKKIVRLAHTFEELNIQVMYKANEKPWYESEYILQIIPDDT